MKNFSSQFMGLVFALTVVALIGFGSGCSKVQSPQSLPSGAGGLSQLENQAIEKIIEQNSDASIKLFTVSEKLGVQSYLLQAHEVKDFEQNVLSDDRSAGVYLDGEVTLSSEEGRLDVSEQLLFGGKEEFGLEEWNEKFPNADGRGVKVSVVDDGVAPARPGLSVTSNGKAKIIGIRSQSPEHSLVLRATGSACRKEDTDVAAAVSQWKIEAKSIPAIETADFTQSFALSGCGISTDLRWKSPDCSNLSDFVGTGGMIKEKEGKYASLVAIKDSRVYVLVDFDANGVISDDEVLTPVSDQGGKIKVFKNGEALSFDFTDASQWSSLPGSTDNPLDPSLKCNPSDDRGVLTIKYPETSNTTGSHGEGVAAIATGFRIGNRAFDGVAPGAQVVDVQLGSARRYTISEIARALHTAGLSGDIVNLSYSLYFSSVESQAAMGRALNRILGVTNALYFFSAGNNGPGRSSMNRGLLYPDFGVAVGAYLNGRMSQSTFGSAAPIEGVVTYSSRGPGLDGATSALVVSPLAGIYVGPADGGYRPFSGTSSATPALSGFSARVLSQIRATGLPWNRKLYRQALIEGARPIPGVAFIDQGYGLPQLTKTFERYTALVKATESKSVPGIEMGGIQARGAGVASSVNPYGVARKGILVRGAWDKYDEYLVSLGFSFESDWSEIEKRNHSERIRIETKAPWLSKHEDMLLSYAGTSFIVQIDYSQMQPGEYLDEIRIYRVSDNKLMQVIPVSVFIPMKDDEGLHSIRAEVLKRDLTRLFVQKPEWADFAVIRRQASAGERLCGRFGVYAPNGVRLTTLGSRSGAILEETSYATPFNGVYEVIPEGRLNHTTCPKNQVMNIDIQWIGLSFMTRSTSMKDKDLILNLTAETRAPLQSGSLSFSNPALQYSISMGGSTSGAFEWENENVDFSKAKSVQFALEESMADKMRSQGAFFFFEYYLTSMDRKTAPESLGGGNVHMESAWSAPVSLEKREWPARLSMNAFDWNPEAGSGIGFPKNLTLHVREEREELSGFKAEVPVFELMGSQPVSFMTSVKGWGANQTAGVGMNCKFTPSGFSLPVPCGVISLE